MSYLSIWPRPHSRKPTGRLKSKQAGKLLPLETMCATSYMRRLKTAHGIVRQRRSEVMRCLVDFTLFLGTIEEHLQHCRRQCRFAEEHVHPNFVCFGGRECHTDGRRELDGVGGDGVRDSVVFCILLFTRILVLDELAHLIYDALKYMQDDLTTSKQPQHRL